MCCAWLKAEVYKYKTMVDELMQALAASQERLTLEHARSDKLTEKLRLEYARSDKLTQRVIRLEKEQWGQI